MEILFVASEAFPLAKVGGLADVTSSLALALHKLGHKTSLIIPRYRSIRGPAMDVPRGEFFLSFVGSHEQVSVKMIELREKIPVYLVENERHFGTEEIYTRDELERFLFFSLTIPRIVSQLGLHPDVVHCHDWHCALVPLWFKRAGMKVPCVFTIHNLAYQGSFGQQFFLDYGLSDIWYQYAPPDAPRPPLNFMGQGIMLADVVTTVSPTYASEIMTAEYGLGLEQLLNYRRRDVRGILNGIDYDQYNPASDPYLESSYDCATMERRANNKSALQKKAGLPESPDIPLIGMVSRLEEQKGIDLVLQAMDQFTGETNAQLVVLGQGREDYHEMLGQAALRYPARLSAFTTNDESLAHLIYGGSDLFLMPSRFEPCGLGQMIAMRYGSIPVVRRTGGLADTVKDVSQENGNGFVFQNYTAEEMLQAIKRAEKGFYRREEWTNLVMRNMKLDFSWKHSAAEYEEVYLRARMMSQTC